MSKNRSESEPWQHTDAEGKKIVHGDKYLYKARGGREKEYVGVVEWHPRFGYVFLSDEGHSRVAIPFEYVGHRQLSYPRLRRVKNE